MRPLLPALVLLSVALHADTVTLNDGTEHEGEVLSASDDTVVLRVRMGGMKGSINIPKKDVAAITRGDLPADQVLKAAQPLIAAAETAANSGDKDACIAKWTAVAEHFQRHKGYSAKVRDAYQRVLLQDPEHTAARVALGFTKDSNGKWIHREEQRRVLREQAESAELRIGPRDDEARLRKQADAEAERHALEVANAKLRSDLSMERMVNAQLAKLRQQESGLEYVNTYGPYYYGGYGVRAGVPYYSDPYANGFGGGNFVRTFEGNAPFLVTSYGPRCAVGTGGGIYDSGYSNSYSGGFSFDLSGRSGPFSFRGGLNNGFVGRGLRNFR